MDNNQNKNNNKVQYMRAQYNDINIYDSTITDPVEVYYNRALMVNEFLSTDPQLTENNIMSWHENLIYLDHSILKVTTNYKNEQQMPQMLKQLLILYEEIRIKFDLILKRFPNLSHIIQEEFKNKLKFMKQDPQQKRVYQSQYFNFGGQINEKEDRQTEFKNYQLNSFLKPQYRDVIKKTITSFLNSQGGTIYLGIRDYDMTVQGVDLSRKDMDDMKLKISEIRRQIEPECNQLVNVDFIPIKKWGAFSQGKWVVRIKVSQGDLKKMYAYKCGDNYSLESAFREDGSTQRYEVGKFLDETRHIAVNGREKAQSVQYSEPDPNSHLCEANEVSYKYDQLKNDIKNQNGGQKNHQKEDKGFNKNPFSAANKGGSNSKNQPKNQIPQYQPPQPQQVYQFQQQPQQFQNNATNQSDQKLIEYQKNQISQLELQLLQKNIQFNNTQENLSKMHEKELKIKELESEISILKNRLKEAEDKIKNMQIEIEDYNAKKQDQMFMYQKVYESQQECIRNMAQIEILNNQITDLKRQLQESNQREMLNSIPSNNLNQIQQNQNSANQFQQPFQNFNNDNAINAIKANNNNNNNNNNFNWNANNNNNQQNMNAYNYNQQEQRSAYQINFDNNNFQENKNIDVNSNQIINQEDANKFNTNYNGKNINNNNNNFNQQNKSYNKQYGNNQEESNKRNCQNDSKPFLNKINQKTHQSQEEQNPNQKQQVNKVNNKQSTKEKQEYFDDFGGSDKKKRRDSFEKKDDQQINIQSDNNMNNFNKKNNNNKQKFQTNNQQKHPQQTDDGFTYVKSKKSQNIYVEAKNQDIAKVLKQSQLETQNNNQFGQLSQIYDNDEQIKDSNSKSKQQQNIEEEIEEVEEEEEKQKNQNYLSLSQIPVNIDNLTNEDYENIPYCIIISFGYEESAQQGYQILLDLCQNEFNAQIRLGKEKRIVGMFFESNLLQRKCFGFMIKKDGPLDDQRFSFLKLISKNKQKEKTVYLNSDYKGLQDIDENKSLAFVLLDNVKNDEQKIKNIFKCNKTIYMQRQYLLSSSEETINGIQYNQIKKMLDNQSLSKSIGKIIGDKVILKGIVKMEQLISLIQTVLSAKYLFRNFKIDENKEEVMIIFANSIEAYLGFLYLNDKKMKLQEYYRGSIKNIAFETILTIPMFDE